VVCPGGVPPWAPVPWPVEPPSPGGFEPARVLDGVSSFVSATGFAAFPAVPPLGSAGPPARAGGAGDTVALVLRAVWSAAVGTLGAVLLTAATRPFAVPLDADATRRSEDSARVGVIAICSGETRAAEAAVSWMAVPGARLMANRSTNPGRGTNRPATTASSTGAVAIKTSPRDPDRPTVRRSKDGVRTDRRCSPSVELADTMLRGSVGAHCAESHKRGRCEDGQQRRLGADYPATDSREICCRHATPLRTGIGRAIRVTALRPASGRSTHGRRGRSGSGSRSRPDAQPLRRRGPSCAAAPRRGGAVPAGRTPSVSARSGP
jgi:hypothetical protein